MIDLSRSCRIQKRAAETREDHHQIITMHCYVEKKKKEGGFRVVVHELRWTAQSSKEKVRVTCMIVEWLQETEWATARGTVYIAV